MRRAAKSLVLVFAASACIPAPEADACGATRLSYLVGQHQSAAMELPQGAPIGVLHPDSLRTEDYSPARINIEVDANGDIASIWCG